MMIIVLIYDISFNQKYYQMLEESLYSSLYYAQQNLLIVCHYILTKVSIESRTNIWVQKLSILLQKKLKTVKRLEHINGIKKSNEQIKKILKLIFK